jgi:hypothetical protein
VTRALLNALAAAAVAAHGLVLGMYWGRLPDRVPTHFNAAGNPDAYGSRSMLLVLLLASLGIFALLTVASALPRFLNYPARVTEENRARMEPLALDMLAWLKLAVVCLIGYIAWGTIQVAMGRMSGLSFWFLPATLAAVFGITLYYIFRMRSVA